MAWNTVDTRRRLQQAATEEFAAYGLHGTTVDRIAARAGVNKERLYNYFGDKQRLFATVLADELAKVAEAVPVASFLDQDVGEYAGRVFDYHAANPHLVRLLHWEALAYGNAEIPDERGRSVYYHQKVDAFARSQREGLLDDDLGPRHLLFLVLALADWWFAVPQLARMITGCKMDDTAEHARRRAVVVQAARRLALPRAPAPAGGRSDQTLNIQPHERTAAGG
jgi:AcrR family transcriptional regulator